MIIAWLSLTVMTVISICNNIIANYSHDSDSR